MECRVCAMAMGLSDFVPPPFHTLDNLMTDYRRGWTLEPHYLDSHPVSAHFHLSDFEPIA